MRATILYVDKDIIVVHKPAGLATQTAAVGQPDLVSELKNHLRGGYLGIVHRLDQPVEGVLVFGKNKNAAAALSGQLSEGVLNKSYYCVICGQASAVEGTLSDHLYKNKENRAEIVPEEQAAERQAKPAVLRYRVVESRTVEGELLSLADIALETGRFHQIRAQMAHAGMPLLGDQKYGDQRTREISGKLRVRGVALCAYELELAHPVKRERMRFLTEPQAEIFRSFSGIASPKSSKKN